MADITLRIAWYRLGETYKSLTENWQGLAQSYEHFSLSRLDIVDMLFLGWLLAAFVIIGIVNLYVRFAKWRIGRQRALDGKQPVDKAASVAVTSRVAGDGETVRWLNAAVTWLGKRQQIDWLIDACLHSLTEEAKKHSPTEVQIRFDKTDIAQKMSSVEFASVSTDTSNPELLTILASVAVSDVSLSVSIVTSTVTSLQAVSCDARITELRGLLQVQSRVTGEVVSVKFHSSPQLKMQLIPSDYSSIDRAATESVIRSAICGFKLELSWPPGGLLEKQATSTLLTANHISTLASKPSDDVDHRQQVQRQASSTDRSSNTSDLVRQWQKDISGRASDQSTVSESKLVARSDSSRLQATPASVRTSRDRRLLVKMIKANGLMNKDFTGSCDPYCTVMADMPPQQHMTSVVKNTINPFFDEHFLLNITDETKQIKFEVFDRNRAKPADEFLGRAVVAIDEVRRVPSSRQIIPLTGKTSAMTSTSGSITVEFLLMEGGPESNASDVQSSEMLTAPYRYIETSHTMMPGGTMVTTSTVLTDRLRDGLAQPAYNESPIRVEKSETSSSYNSQNSVLTSQTSNIDLNNRPGRQGLNNSDGVTEMALRELSHQQHSAQPKTTVITLTGRPKEQVLPTINTVQAPSNDDPVHNPYSTLPHSTEMKKKSFASALKKRFSRGGSKQSRAVSADRFTDATSPAFRDNSLLRPPTDSSTGARIPEEGDLSDSSLARKTRSHSLSASFRNLFHRSKKGANNLPPSGAASRESSVSRATPGPLPAHTAALRGSDGSAQQPSPQLSTASRGRHHTPEYSPQTGYPYSTSVPAKTSPLYQH